MNITGETWEIFLWKFQVKNGRARKDSQVFYILFILELECNTFSTGCCCAYEI